MTVTFTEPAVSGAGVKTIVFACRWCALLGAERAGRERLAMDSEFRVIPVECAGAISLDLVLRAFADGAHGVAVMGCHFGGCRHNEANRNAHARLSMMGTALDVIGMRPERLLLSWGTAHEGHQFASVMNEFVRTLRTLTNEPDLPLLRGAFTLPNTGNSEPQRSVTGEARP